jgi:ABC-2 type transport system permease protein
VKWLIYTLLPTAFVVFMPYQVIQSFNLPVLLLVLGVDVFAMLLARRVFAAGLKRYASGNRMGARL